jgi:hypothetical protein
MEICTNNTIKEYRSKYFINEKPTIINIIKNYLNKIDQVKGKFNKIIVVEHLLVCLIANFEHFYTHKKFVSTIRNKMDELIIDITTLKNNLNDTYPLSEHDNIIEKCNKCIELCQLTLFMTSTIEI